MPTNWVRSVRALDKIIQFSFANQRIFLTSLHSVQKKTIHYFPIIVSSQGRFQFSD